MIPKNQNGFIPIIVFVVGILVISGAVVGGSFYVKKSLNQKAEESVVETIVNPSPSTTSSSTPTIADSWKSYSNPNMGIELQYPSDFEINTIQEEKDFKLHNFSFGDSTVHEGESVLFTKKNIDMDIKLEDVQGEGAMSYAIMVNDIVVEVGNIEGVSGKSDLEKIVNDFFNDPYYDSSKGSRLNEPIIIAGKQGYKVATSNKEPMMMYNIIFPGKDDQILYLDITVLPYTDPHSCAFTGGCQTAPFSPRYQPNVETVNKILSSIKFL